MFCLLRSLLNVYNLSLMLILLFCFLGYFFFLRQMLRKDKKNGKIWGAYLSAIVKMFLCLLEILLQKIHFITDVDTSLSQSFKYTLAKEIAISMISH